MKRLSLCLIVAGMALVGSSLATTKQQNTANITGQIGYGIGTMYVYGENEGIICDGGSLPCTIIGKPGFPLSNRFGLISVLDLNNPSKVQILSTQSSY